MVTVALRCLFEMCLIDNKKPFAPLGRGTKGYDFSNDTRGLLGPPAFLAAR